MGMFSQIGKAFDSAQTQQEKMQKFQDQQQQRQGGGRASEAASIFGQGLGGANAAIQAQYLLSNQQQGYSIHLEEYQAIKQMDSNKKIYVDLNHTCFKCLKKERNYHCDSELCLTKCYDTAFIYMRVGLNEINQFAYENNISY